MKFLSGEFFLRDKANSGTIVFTRALWVAGLGVIFTVLVREALHPESVCAFSGSELRKALHASVPVAGAFFAAAYVALYARFASQWTYLAGVYNQIMAARLRPVEGEEAQTTLSQWQAGFIADAVELHLALKPMFAAVILAMLGRKGVRAAYVDANGERDTAALETVLRKLLKIAPPTPPSPEGEADSP